MVKDTPAAGKADATDVAYEATVSMVHANLVSLVVLVVALLLFVLPHRWIWAGDPAVLGGTPTLLSFALIILIFLLAIVMHELLHAIGFMLAGKVPLSSISFGVLWKALAPYAHCHASMTVSAYRVSVALPGVVLGLIPGLLGVVFDSELLALMGALMTGAAGGDLAILLVLRSVPGDALVRDHPSLPGCQILKEKYREYNQE
jgi:hypothetical protein